VTVVSADVVVVGAGVVGASVALELARDGRSVVVLDKAGGIGHGSTSASSAIVRFGYSTFAGVALAWESHAAWLDWEAHLGHRDPAGLASFVRTGMLVLGPTDPRTTELFDRAGVPWESWSPEEVIRRMPGLDPGAYGPPVPVTSERFFDPAHGLLGGLWTADAGYVDDPTLAAHNLAAAAERHGARFLLRREVVAVARPDERWLVSTAAGEVVSAPVAVNAAGPWSGRLNALAGVGGDFSVTTRPLRQEVHVVAAGPGAPGATLADPDLGTYSRPSGPAGAELLVGGLEPECDPLEWLDEPDDADPRPTRERFEAQVTRAARRYPALPVPNRPTGTAGVYDVADDWTPIYDRTDQPGFFVAIGTSGNQFKNAPVVGRVMAALVAAVEEGHDHDAEPVSLRLPRTGLEVDLGTFSRRRRVGVGSNVLG
jgi:glycine/D-amino acid oxidase-like deaminating enzyme